MIDVLGFTAFLHAWIDMVDFEAVFFSLLQLFGRETVLFGYLKSYLIHNTFLLVSKWHNTSQHVSFYVQLVLREPFYHSLQSKWFWYGNFSRLSSLASSWVYSNQLQLYCFCKYNHDFSNLRCLDESLTLFPQPSSGQLQ